MSGIDVIKSTAHTLADRFSDRYDASLVDEFAQLCMGTTVELGVPLLEALKGSAFIAASNFDNSTGPDTAHRLLGDEELMGDILGLIRQLDKEIV